MALFQVLLPTLAIILFIVFKLNHEQKRWLFKIPVLFSSTALSFIIGHAARGVMGFYGAILCDIFLFPAMLLIKKIWTRQENKLKGTVPQIQKPRALPQRLALNPAMA